MSPVTCVSVRPHIFPHKVCNRSTAYNAGVQGLHANVAVLDAELVGIDREQQSISLSTGQKVLYGMLVIAAGLDQSSSKDIAGQVEGPFTNVISLKSAAKLSTEVDLLLQLLTCSCLYMTDCQSAGASTAVAICINGCLMGLVMTSCCGSICTTFASQGAPNRQDCLQQVSGTALVTIGRFISSLRQVLQCHS